MKVALRDLVRQRQVPVKLKNQFEIMSLEPEDDKVVAVEHEKFLPVKTVDEQVEMTDGDDNFDGPAVENICGLF